MAKSMRVIDENGKQIGILEREKALGLALEKEVDLVEVAPTANPPVTKIIDYNKFLYQIKKKKQEEKKKSSGGATKEIRLGLFIGPHDLEIKLKKAREFLKVGNKVKFAVRFKGREMAKRYIGEELLKNVLGQLQELAKVEKNIYMEGRQMVIIVSRLK